MTIDVGWEVLLSLMLLGGVTAVDGTSFGQFMVSRPFVAATMAGWVSGDAVAGAVIGVVLEAFHLAVLPVGAAKYPEGGPAAVAGGAVYALSTGSTGALLVITLLVLGLEWIGGESVRLIRTGNVRLISAHDGMPRTATHLERLHVLAIGVDFLRGMLLVAVGLLVLIAGSRIGIALWGVDDAVTRMAATAIVAGLFAGALRVVGCRIWYAVVGAAGALVLLAL